jgi:two-component system response regulator PilR (NtrC family)
MGLLTRHSWPGNVRELENVIERAVALETTDAIEPDRLPESLFAAGATRDDAPDFSNGFSLDRHLETIEADLLRRALDRSEGNRAVAARLLGVTPRSLRYLIRKHDVNVAE